MNDVEQKKTKAGRQSSKQNRKTEKQKKHDERTGIRHVPALFLSKKLPWSRRVRRGSLHKNRQSNIDIEKSQGFSVLCSQGLGKLVHALIFR